jgi:hypothetical protein
LRWSVGGLGVEALESLLHSVVATPGVPLAQRWKARPDAS